MCLYSKKKVPYVSKRDKKVYKVFYKTYEGRLMTPFVKMEMELGRMYEEERVEPIETYAAFRLEHGFFHSFANTSCAWGLKEYLEVWLDKNKYDGCVVVECTIPKGTEYYRGIGKDIASRVLVVGKILNDREIAAFIKKKRLP